MAGPAAFATPPFGVTVGTTLVAHWSDGQPLVGARDGPVGGRIVGLNFYPPSSDARGDFWDLTTDGARLMANALLYVASAFAAPPTFSIAFDTPDVDEVCVCTPLLMNTKVDGKQNWYVETLGGDLAITAIAHAVNGADPETVVARVYDPSDSLLATLTASYPPGTPAGTEVADAVTITGTPAGAIYRVEVTPPPPTPPTQPHYRLRFGNAEAAGTGSPSSPSFERTPTRWYFNVGAGEDLNLRVLVGGAPDPSATLTYTLFDPTGTAHSRGSVTATTSGDAFIDVPGAAAGTWALDVTAASGHYRLDKATGSGPGRLPVVAVRRVRDAVGRGARRRPGGSSAFHGRAG